MSELSKYERETIIVYNEAEPMASVYTHNQSLRKRLANFAAEFNDCTLIKSCAEADEYSLPKKWVKINKPKQLTEEQRQNAAKRMMCNLGRKEKQCET